MAACTPGDWHQADPYGPTFIIIVGQQPNIRTFKCPQSLINHYSTWFELFKNDNENVEVRLPGDDPETFNMVMNCIHNRGFFYTPSSALETFDKFTELWAFGEVRRMPLVQNIALDMFANKIRFGGELPDRWCVEYMWEKTKSGGMLRKMLVEMVRAMWLPENNKSNIWDELDGGKSENPENLIDMMDGFNQSSRNVRVSEQMWRKLKACEWHVHAEGVFCEGAEEEILDRGRGEDDAEQGLERGGRGAHRGIGHASESPSHYFGH